MKTRTLTICLLAACFATESAFAQINAIPNATSNSIKVSGTVANENVQILLLKPGFGVSDAEIAAASSDKSKLVDIVEYFGQVTSKNNNIEVDIPMRADAAKDGYLLIVDGDKSTTYFATLSDKLTNMVPAAKAALTSASFASFVASDAKYFCNSDLLESLSSTDNVAKYAASILDKFKTSSDSDFMSKMPSALNMGIVMEALNEKKINDFDIIKSMTDNSDMVVPLDKADLIKTDKLKNVISDVSGKNFSSPDEYKRKLSESIFINAIYDAANMTNENKKDFFETYALQLGMNLQYYNQLTKNKRIEAIAKLLIENSKSLPLLQSSLDEICQGLATPITDGGRGGGGGGAGIATISNSPAFNGGNASNALKDLSECKWAQPAIDYLVKSNMISGYGDNTFKPSKNISRAEFICIIARKYLPQNSYAGSFSDVESNSWYFNYVESAYNNGIISGKANNVFAPNENISRQDMAVILYRLAEFLGYEISGVSTEFADNSEIAEYSKNAIYNLRGAGIVNGDENGNFNPNAPATRAEAAQMIYGFIKSFE